MRKEANWQTTSELLRVIIIDDDPVNNFLCKLIIKRALGEIVIETFIKPDEGLRFLKEEFSSSDNKIPAILLLDINMPAMNGWQFLEHYAKLDEKIKNQVRLYILSSSIDITDKQRAAENKHVIDYIEKPIRKQKLLSIASVTAQQEI